MKTNEEMLKALESLLVIDSVCRPGEGGKPFGIGADKALETALAICADLGFKTKNCDGQIGWAEIGEGDEMIGILASRRCSRRQRLGLSRFWLHRS